MIKKETDKQLRIRDEIKDYLVANGLDVLEGIFDIDPKSPSGYINSGILQE